MRRYQNPTVWSAGHQVYDGAAGPRWRSSASRVANDPSNHDVGSTPGGGTCS
jgi:hypothetical protein